MTSAVGPLEFTDHLGVPLQEGLLLVHNTLVRLNLRHRVKIGCAGKVIGAFDIAHNIALGPTGATSRVGSCSTGGAAGADLPHRCVPHGRDDTVPASAKRRCWCPTRASACTAFTKTRCLR